MRTYVQKDINNYNVQILFKVTFVGRPGITLLQQHNYCM